jgi:glycosyltransferase involved in cell wall biosynthesis
MLAAMRLLHLADRRGDRGGAFAWTAGLIDALATDHEVRLVVGRDEGGPRPACRADVRAGLDARGPVPVGLDDVVRTFRPDVVHVHNVVNPAVLEWAAARRDSLLTVQDHRFFCPGRGKWTLSGEPCRRPLSREACASCFDDAAYAVEVHALTERRLAAVARMPVTVLSRYMREELVAAGVPAAQVHVVPPFVEREPEDAPAGPPCVLFVGRLVEAKGVRDAVAAWRQSCVGLPLVVAGSGPLREELEALAAAGEQIEVLGWVDRARLGAVYARARAVLMASRWQEPFGIVGLEALSHGVPVVAWESGGIGEWHPGPGLVRWGDREALAAALRRAVARRVALPPRFDRDEAVGRLLSIYARIATHGIRAR